jgi:hypothetical protein
MRNAIATLLALTAGCFQVDGPTASGQLVGRGGDHGDFTFVPRSCTAGTTREFLGADLTDFAQQVRVFEHPLWGRMVTLGPPEMPWLILDEQSDCSAFAEQIVFHRCGNCVKGDYDLDDATIDGQLQLDCATPGGGRLTGQLAFLGCLNPGEEPIE